MDSSNSLLGEYVRIEDIAAEIKAGVLSSVNDITTLHAIPILLQCISDLIRLLSRRDLLLRFRSQIRPHLHLPRDSQGSVLTASANDHPHRHVLTASPNHQPQCGVLTANSNHHYYNVFTLLLPAPLSIRDFLLRIRKYSPKVSTAVYLHLALLIFQLLLLSDEFVLHNLNAHRILLSAIRCSAKLLEDSYQKQSAYAAVTGVSQSDLLIFEVSLLYLLGFDIVAHQSGLDHFLTDSWLQLYEFCNANNL